MNAEELVRQGIEAFKTGDQARARDLFIQATQTDPDYQLALLWLASVTDEPVQKRQYLQRAIAINPNNGAGWRAAEDLSRLDSGSDALPLPPPPDAPAQHPDSTTPPPAKRSNSPILWVALAVLGGMVLLIPIICIVVIGILTLLGGQVSEVFETVNSGLE
jgi:ferric-dicitrate binding protein FerR (iron transport regulator)